LQQFCGGLTAVESVAKIWTYPIKSMQGHPIETATLGEFGIGTDRIFATRDLERGGIRGAKKIPGLMQCRAEYVRPTAGATSEAALIDIAVTLPDGRTGHAGDPALDSALSEFLGRQVQLEALPTAENLEHFRRGAPDSTDVIAEMRAIFGRDPHEPLPNFSVFPPELGEFESPPGAHYDCYPLMVMTTSAIAALEAVLGDSGADIRRFRPSFVIDTGSQPGHVEFFWKGRRARVGGAEIEFLDPCPRCVMVTQRIDDQAPADRSVLRHIVAELNQNLGIYAKVVTPGHIRSGDSLSWLS
jgi:uncharacterized protein YcbX